MPLLLHIPYWISIAALLAICWMLWRSNQAKDKFLGDLSYRFRQDWLAVQELAKAEKLRDYTTHRIFTRPPSPEEHAAEHYHDDDLDSADDTQFSLDEMTGKAIE